jgi:hypothetical protein
MTGTFVELPIGADFEMDLIGEEADWLVRGTLSFHVHPARYVLGGRFDPLIRPCRPICRCGLSARELVVILYYHKLVQ